MPDDQSAPDSVRHWDYPEPVEPPSAVFFWAAFLLLIAAWTAFEHSYWVSAAVFLWASVASLWSNHKADKEYEIAKLQFKLALYQQFPIQHPHQENRIRDLEPKIEAAIKGQSKWPSFTELVGLCGAMGIVVLIVWSIDHWLWEGSSLKSELYGKIDYAINNLIPWPWIFFVVFVIVALCLIYNSIAETTKLVKQRAWHKLIDGWGTFFALGVGWFAGYSLFWWVWGLDHRWFGLSRFGLPFPYAGGFGGAVLFVWIQSQITYWYDNRSRLSKR